AAGRPELGQRRRSDPRSRASMKTAPRAIVSVHDKDGVQELARGLAARGFEILSTGGTAAALREADVGVVSVSDVTGFPEILDGRVKTLHPKVHAGILSRRDLPAHQDQMAKLGLVP